MLWSNLWRKFSVVTVFTREVLDAAKNTAALQMGIPWLTPSLTLTQRCCARNCVRSDLEYIHSFNDRRKIINGMALKLIQLRSKPLSPQIKSGCGFYTWYDHSTSMPRICLHFTACNDPEPCTGDSLFILKTNGYNTAFLWQVYTTHSGSGCHSAPPSCPSTPNPTSPKPPSPEVISSQNNQSRMFSIKADTLTHSRQSTHC